VTATITEDVEATSAAHRVRAAGVFLLAMLSGATDAIGFIALGGAFTSVMTGNMVLFGVGIAHGDIDQIANTAAAITSFVIGCAIGARVAGSARPDDPTWPRAVTTALVLQSALFVIYTIGYEAADFGKPGPVMQPVLLSLTAVGLGVQSAAVQRFGQSGLSTTYMTGTLTTMVTRLATGGRARHVFPSLRLLAGLIGGAVLGGVLALYARPVAPVLQLGLLAAVVVMADRQHKRGI
jgi:uncharacterized membrane protein YoaK (UPF0700 family)